MNRQLKALKMKQFREQQTKKRLGFSQRQVLVVVACYMLSEYNIQYTQEVASCMYRSLKGHRMHPEPEFPIRDWFLEAPEDLVWGENRSKYKENVTLEATRLLAEVKSVLWVRDQNFSREVAPSSHELINNFSKEVSLLGQPWMSDAVVASSNQVNHSKQRRARKWVQKFRHKWCVTRGALPCLDAPGKQQLKVKVGSL